MAPSNRNSASELSGEPGSSEIPIPFERREGNAKCFGGFRFRQAPEEAQFYNAGGAGIHNLEAREGFIDLDKVVSLRRCREVRQLR